MLQKKIWKQYLKNESWIYNSETYVWQSISFPINLGQINFHSEFGFKFLEDLKNNNKKKNKLIVKTNIKIYKEVE